MKLISVENGVAAEAPEKVSAAILAANAFGALFGSE
jgi:hypothetical protein